jgi:hypothetical protein
MTRAPRLTTTPPAAPRLATQVESIPGVFSLDPYFDALFALAARAEREHATPAPRIAA